MDTVSTIPKNFKVNEVFVELKSELEGKFITIGKEIFFKCMDFNIIIKLDINEEKIRAAVDYVENYILQVYNKGIEDKNNLSDSDLSLFYHVKNVTTRSNSRVLIIGYEKNSIWGIRGTITRLKINSDIISLEKNIELESKSKYYNILNDIRKKNEEFEYDAFIVDIPNLYIINKNPSNTQSLIYNLESLGKKIIYIIPDGEIYKDKFVKIFGDRNFIEKNRFIYPENNRATFEKIERILLH